MTRTTRLAIFALAFASISGSSVAATLSGRVTRVIDGDTVVFQVNGQHPHVRLEGIDAPEHDQHYGQASKRSLAALVLNQNVRIDSDGTGKYGRIIGTIYVHSLNVNEEQVKRGMAWDYKRYSHDSQMLGLEKNARSAHRGLWHDPNPEAPWIYRHSGHH